MKKIFSMFLALMLFCSATVTASAASFQMNIDKNIIDAGENVVVTVKLDEKITGDYRSVQGQLKYDTDLMTYDSHEMGEKYAHYSAKYLTTKNFFTFSYVDSTADGFSEIPEGTIVSIVFKTKKDITEDHLNSKLELIMSVQDTSGNTEKTNTDISLMVCAAHTWKTEYELDKKATIAYDGYKSIHCTKCEAKKDVITIPKAATVELDSNKCTYNGKVASPKIVVKDAKGNDISSKNYSITTPVGRINAGKYVYVVTFKNDYEGSEQLMLTINPASITEMKLYYSAYTYSNAVKQPAVTVKAGSLIVANKLKSSSNNVKLTYASGRKNVGSYKVTATGKGNYTGTITKTFKINPKGVNISALSKGKKSFTVKWKKPTATYRKQMTGYQIKYSTSSKMTGAKTVSVKSTTATSKKISSGIKAKKTYYVQLRTYKKIGSTYYYSGWTKTKKVKTK